MNKNSLTKAKEILFVIEKSIEILKIKEQSNNELFSPTNNEIDTKDLQEQNYYIKEE